MTKLSIFLFSFLIVFNCIGQGHLEDEIEIIDITDKESKEEKSVGDLVFTIVEDMPEYPGGDAALLTYIASNTIYPDSAKYKGIEDKVYVSYIVDIDGGIVDARIARGKHEILNEEALRVVNSIKGYKPGVQRGKPVKVMFTMPISFQLQ